MSRRNVCAVIGLLLVSTSASSADDATPMVPDARKAYLVLGATVRPVENAQPKWIHVVRQSGIRLAGSEGLSTDRAIFELTPARYNIRALNFRDNPNSSVDVRRFRPRLRGLRASSGTSLEARPVTS